MLSKPALEETTLGGCGLCPAGAGQIHLAAVTVVVLLQHQSKGTTKLAAALARLYDIISVLQYIDKKGALQYHKLQSVPAGTMSN